MNSDDLAKRILQRLNMDKRDWRRESLRRVGEESNAAYLERLRQLSRASNGYVNCIRVGGWNEHGEYILLQVIRRFPHKCRPVR